MKELVCPNGGNVFTVDEADYASNGSYWSSSLYTGNPDDACNMYFSSGGVCIYDYYNRCDWLSVRPVCE